MKIRINLICLLVACTACHSERIHCPIPGYELVWHDEFEDSDLKRNWTFEQWEPGRVNHELQKYVEGEYKCYSPVQVNDGVLSITAYKLGDEVISARMNSRASWRYGYIEARIKLPKGRGTWPAFWMMPIDMSQRWPYCGEIDIMEEVGAVADETSSSIHCGAYNHPSHTQKTVKRITVGAEQEFHTYGVEWTADGIKFYVDGIHDDTTLSFVNDKKNDQDTWPFDKEFHIILNLAWGGDWGGFKGVDPGALPATMEVDYVRVFQATSDVPEAERLRER